jgi:hypothetical protein
MNGIFWKRAAVAALLVGATSFNRAEAQVSGGASPIFLPPPNRPDLDEFRKRREQFRRNLRQFLKDNPQARQLFGPRTILTPPPLTNAYVPAPYGAGGYGPGYDRQIQSQYGEAEVAAPLPQADEKNPELAKAIAATGIFNKDGKIEWPLGLRVLPGGEVDRLRTQLSAMFEVLAVQMVQGTVNPLLLVEINQAVDRLAVLLQLDRTTRRSLTGQNLYDESSRFLAKMREATRIAIAVQPSESNPYTSSKNGASAYGANGSSNGGNGSPNGGGQIRRSRLATETSGGISFPAQPARPKENNPY